MLPELFDSRTELLNGRLAIRGLKLRKALLVYLGTFFSSKNMICQLIVMLSEPYDTLGIENSNFKSYLGPQAIYKHFSSFPASEKSPRGLSHYLAINTAYYTARSGSVCQYLGKSSPLYNQLCPTNHIRLPMRYTVLYFPARIAVFCGVV